MSCSMCQLAGTGLRRVIQGMPTARALNTPADAAYDVFKTTGKQGGISMALQGRKYSLAEG